ncbi:putative HNH endonuclease [Pseudomonas phage ventosus]|uniref:Putative HNH endonuclease n=1 Tax=Pseudomonas phage ventosus TaxID=2048980 RepID=A0A2H4P845_9CAUD|nr:putative HNH endonuclease [Pseudomonas phage ventosus]
MECEQCSKEFAGNGRQKRFCQTECRLKWYAANSGKYVDKYKRDRPHLVMLKSARHRAAKAGVPFDLTAEDIVIPEHCPVFGVPLETASGAAKQNSPSLDKIIPELGYVKGNVQVISNLANVMKHDATPEQLIMFAEWVLKTQKEGE